MNGWFLKIVMLDDRFIVVFFKIFRIGFYTQRQINLTEYSFLLGIYKFDIKIGINKLKDIKLRMPKIHGNA